MPQLDGCRTKKAMPGIVRRDRPLRLGPMRRLTENAQKKAFAMRRKASFTGE
jgi:hypothetical protein